MPVYKTIQSYLCKREIVIESTSERDAADLKGDILYESHDICFEWYDTESVELAIEGEDY